MLPVFGPAKSFVPVLLAFIRRGPVLPDPGTDGGPEHGVPTLGWPVFKKCKRNGIYILGYSKLNKTKENGR